MAAAEQGTCRRAHARGAAYASPNSPSDNGITAHQIEWKSFSCDRPSCATEKAMIHQVREDEHSSCVASPFGPVYTCPLQSGLCAACQHYNTHLGDEALPVTVSLLLVSFVWTGDRDTGLPNSFGGCLLFQTTSGSPRQPCSSQDALYACSYKKRAHTHAHTLAHTHTFWASDLPETCIKY